MIRILYILMNVVLGINADLKDNGKSLIRKGYNIFKEEQRASLY